MSLVTPQHPQYCTYCGWMLTEDNRCRNHDCTMYDRLSSPPSVPIPPAQSFLFRLRSQTAYVVVIAVLVLLLVGSGFFILGLLVKGNMQAATSNGSSGSNSSGNISSHSDPTPTPTPTPTDTPTPTPSPTSTPVSKPGVLCTAGTNNWANWNAGSSGWSINNGVLTSDGTQSTQWYNMSLTAPPACQPRSQDENYSVTATAIPIGSPDNFNFLIFVRGNTDNGLQGYAMGIGRYLGDYTEAISIHGFTIYNEIASTGINSPSTWRL